MVEGSNMQAAETVYEFGSSPDEDEDNDESQTQSSGNNATKKRSQSQQGATPQQPPTRIAGTNLRPNKTSSTSIDQKLNTSFSSISDNYASAVNKMANNPKQTSSSAVGLHNVSTSEEQLLIRAEAESKANTLTTASHDQSGAGSIGGDGGSVGANSSLNLIGGSISNMSNTSISSATNSSRGNVSQSGNQSNISASSHKSGGHQQSTTSSQQQNPNFDSNVISERVKNLATQIYQELKRIISRCNYDEDILSGLMPLIVRVLESLDLALIENQQLQVELELCKDDNEQLVIMFEKEKASKRAIDKKLIESEYAYEEERQQYQQKIESLDNIVKMYELKAKNASDQATRFEEKEAERKKEYNKLHDRYTELLKSHCDIVERFRQLVGSNEAANLTSVNVPQQMVVSSTDLTIGDLQAHPLNKMKLSHDDNDFHDRSTSSRQLKSWNADTELTLEDASLVVIDDLVDSHQQHQKSGDTSSHNDSDRATIELEGEHEKEGENDSIAYTSMEKEFRKLIQENKDLLNTKNALNVVKDDLIAEVDRLTNEVSMYEQAVEQLNSTKDQMKHKVSTLDAELRKTKEELDKAKQKIRENNEEGVPYSQRKRFGRAEMAKVLMERNNYKERFMELQDAVRYTELVRANRMETEKRSGLWKFFSNLFGAPPPRAIMGSPRTSSPVVSYNSSAVVPTGGDATSLVGQVVAADALQTSAISSVGRTPGAGSIWSTNQRLSTQSDLIVLMDSDLNVDRNRAAVGRDSTSGGRVSLDSSGYIHAYGWSLRASSIRGLSSDSPSKISPILGTTSSFVSSSADSFAVSQGVGGANDSVTFGHKLAGLLVPIPQYCRPLTGDSLGMKIWCATSIDLSGGDSAAQYGAGHSKRAVVALANEQAVGQVSVYRDHDSSGSVVNISASTPVKSTAPNQQALSELEHEVSQALGNNSSNDTLGADVSSSSKSVLTNTTTEMVLNALPFTDDVEELSSCVWICSTQHSRSKITIIDIKNKPNELLDSFYVPTFLYCLKCVPGSKGSDLLGLSGAQAELLQQAETSFENQTDRDANDSMVQSAPIMLNMINELILTQKDNFYTLVTVDPKAEKRLRKSRLGGDKMSQTVIEEQLVEAAEASTSGGGVVAAMSMPSVATSGNEQIEKDNEISRILDNDVTDGIATLQKLNDFVAHTQPQACRGEQLIGVQKTTNDDDDDDDKDDEDNSDNNRLQEQGDGDKSDVAYYQPISTHLSTVWMGGKDSVLYVHSAIGQWKDCIACVELHDSILQICHYRGRVFVALADGSLCVFFRNVATKQWEFSQYLLINIGLLNEATSDSLSDLHNNSNTSFDTDNMHLKLSNLSLTKSPDKSNETQSGEQLSGTVETQQPKSADSSKTTRRRAGKVSGVHCLEIANKNLWLGYRNRVLIIDPITLKLKHTFNVVPQVDNQIRQVVSMRDGVFICLRSDLTLRLYSSLRPYQHIQNIDIEPAVTRLISPKTFVISHITAMCVADSTLWIGIAHGIILTIPCKLVPQISEAPMRNSRTGEFEESPSHLSIARFVPKCDINNAQISFHGHRDAVKFFIHAHNLMLSGGQGYLDFRLDMDDQSSKAISDKSHLILWQLPTTQNV